MSAHDNLSPQQFSAHERGWRNRAAAEAQAAARWTHPRLSATDPQPQSQPQPEPHRDAYGWVVHDRSQVPGEGSGHEYKWRDPNRQGADPAAVRDQQAHDAAVEAANPVWDHRPAYSRMKIVPGGLPGLGKRR